MCEPERKSDDRRRLARLVRIANDVRVRRDEIDDVVGLVLGEKLGLDKGEVVGNDNVGVLALHRGKADVGWKGKRDSAAA